MATFSENQVRHLYVADATKGSNVNVEESDALATIAVRYDTAKTHLFFEHLGHGGIVRSDMIDTKNIISVKATDADDLKYPLTRYKVTLDTEVNGGNPIAGQDYILSMEINNYQSLSDESKYYKYGVVHASSGMSASDFYKIMAMSLVQNLRNEDSKLLKVYLETLGEAPETVGTLNPVKASDTKTTLSGTYTGIVIEELPQPWRLGVLAQEPVFFYVHCDSVIDNKDERVWGVVAKVAPANFIEDGHKIADLEYFCMGERGDLYRNVGFPYTIETKYLVDPTKKYNVIDIHYYFEGDNHSPQKSEKDITIVVPKVGETNSVSNVLTNNIIGELKTATGLTIATLDTSAE